MKNENKEWLEKELAKIEEERIEAIAKFDIIEDVLKTTGLKVSAVRSDFLSFKPSCKEDIFKVLKKFPAGSKNTELTFAGKDSIPTNSPYKLTIANYKHIRDSKYAESVIKYDTEEGVSIWISLPFKLFPLREEKRPINPNSRSMRPQMYSHFSLPYGYNLRGVAYSGGSYAYQGATEDFYKLIESVGTIKEEER